MLAQLQFTIDMGVLDVREVLKEYIGDRAAPLCRAHSNFEGLTECGPSQSSCC